MAFYKYLQMGLKIPRQVEYLLHMLSLSLV